MKALLSSLGTRGDVQPILALALALRALGHETRLCVAPNFKEWVESQGFTCFPLGPDLKQLIGARQAPAKPSAEQLRQLAVQSVRAQFPVLTEAAWQCDLIVGAGALQLGTRTMAEKLNIPYVCAAYSPTFLPSADHPPSKMGTYHPLTLPASTNLSLWAEEEESWNELFRATLDEERAQLALAPVPSVYRHILTDQPWLAADPILAPAGASPELNIVQTGAWLLSDPSPLPEPVERFLASGEPPVYFGLGSMRAAPETGQMFIDAARALGRRSIISQGWANLAPTDAGADSLSVGDVAHEKLFTGVAAVVHHGGAGTTMAAARAGKGQVIVPHIYDQYYWAHRIRLLGAGVSTPSGEPLSVRTVSEALRECLRPEVMTRAHELSGALKLDGARIAAARLDQLFG
jgi:vancomycin aglycone glucosyltransferase